MGAGSVIFGYREVGWEGRIYPRSTVLVVEDAEVGGTNEPCPDSGCSLPYAARRAPTTVCFRCLLCSNRYFWGCNPETARR